MPSIVNTFKRFIAGLAFLVGLAATAIILYSLFVAAPASQHDLVSETIDVAIIVAFWATILLFIRRSKPLMTRHLGNKLLISWKSSWQPLPSLS